MKNVILTTFLILLLTSVSLVGLLENNLNPLIFGIVFCVVNRKLLKYKFITGFISSILLSYASFFIGFFGLFGIGYLIDKIVDLLNLKSLDGNIYILISGLLASLSIYFLFTKIYYVKNLRRGFYIMLLSYILVSILVYIIPVIFKEIIMTEFFGLYNLSWLLIVSLFLSYTFNQNRRENEENKYKIKPNAQQRFGEMRG